MPDSSTVKLCALSCPGAATPAGEISFVGHASSTPFSQTRGLAACAAVPFFASNSHSTHAQSSTTPAVSEICTASGVPGGSGGCQMLTYLPPDVATSYQSSVSIGVFVEPTGW